MQEDKKKKKLITRPKTEDEILEEMNRAIEHGVFYTHDEAMRLLKIARERGCKVSDIPAEERHPIEIKWFSDSEEEEND